MDLHEAQGRLTRVLQPHINQPTRDPATVDPNFNVSADTWLMAFRQWALEWAGGVIVETAQLWTTAREGVFGYSAFTVQSYGETLAHHAATGPSFFELRMDVRCAARGPRGHGGNTFSVAANRMLVPGAEPMLTLTIKIDGADVLRVTTRETSIGQPMRVDAVRLSPGGASSLATRRVASGYSRTLIRRGQVVFDPNNPQAMTNAGLGSRPLPRRP